VSRKPIQDIAHFEGSSLQLPITLFSLKPEKLLLGMMGFEWVIHSERSIRDVYPNSVTIELV
jgi:hypothetical protein